MKGQNVYLVEDILVPHFGKETPLVGVEIGVAGGSGSIQMLLNFPNLHLYCIDPWLHIDLQPYEVGGWTQEQHDNGKAEFLNRISLFKDRVTILQTTSDIAVYSIPENIDFIFIDGHHVYDQVKKDITNYYPKVRSGGIVSGHDFLQVYDVTRAVYEYFLGKEMIGFGDDFIWWTIKK
jgi:hypothetical protein